MASRIQISLFKFEVKMKAGSTDIPSSLKAYRGGGSVTQRGLEELEGRYSFQRDGPHIEGPAGVPSCSLNITQMAISSEPVEKLFLCGHSACTLGNADHDYKVLIFGGFGGHRHAAAVVGSKIYVFAGLTDNAISSSLHVLDIDNLQWKELSVSGEWPCARHSHSMVAYGSQIYMFGGYNGKKILGDLYSFDVHKCLWKKEEVAGKSPHARFSHSMFLYKNYLGVIGGCPVGQHDQVLALLDLQLHVWKYVKLNSMSEELILRCTANVVGNDLVMIGGGTA
ncbi:hypothetical protein LWI29_013299 [Acer saccharum]|uniref:Uncharacterized protein n=1 Tax=Acer saccharum TaxID=4024 RepID=A0AA39VFZ9_ACESA|nr:hypothetical protein LWI29_013299 [Acer saccharum]